MEELENEHDKGLYWVVFFICLLFVGILVHNFVFSYKEEEKDKEKEVVDNFDISLYKGIWGLYGEDGDIREELSIDVVDGSTITFSYSKGEDIYFESKTASLDNNIAYFTIEEDDDKVTGKIRFSDNYVFLTVVTSTVDGVVDGTVMLEKMDTED